MLASALSLCSLYGQSGTLSVCKTDSLRYGDKAVERFRLSNANGMTVCVTNFAASLTDVQVPDRDGNIGHVVLGFDTLQHYWGKHPKFGATVGRYANRIRNAELALDGTVFRLERNNRGNCIHGGTNGFHRQVFHTDTCYASADTATVVFSYESAHLEGGFPGNLRLTVAYRLTDKNELVLEYTATTDRPTVVNLTNHTYFNLTGCRSSVRNHVYMIKADSITPTDTDGIPTGKLLAVAGTDYDYTHPQPADRRLERMGKGYDINYRLSKPEGTLGLAAIVTEPVSGRVLKAYTTEPGMQFYIPSADFSCLAGHEGKRYGTFYGFCLEMQHFPDSPHQPAFPSTVLRPGETYRQVTVYKFETILN